MTVQELIDALNKVKDKSLSVYYHNTLGDYEEIDEIEEHENSDVLLFEKDFEYELAKYESWHYKKGYKIKIFV